MERKPNRRPADPVKKGKGATESAVELRETRERVPRRLVSEQFHVSGPLEQLLSIRLPNELEKWMDARIKERDVAEVANGGAGAEAGKREGRDDGMEEEDGAARAPGSR